MHSLHNLNRKTKNNENQANTLREHNCFTKNIIYNFNKLVK